MPRPPRLSPPRHGDVSLERLAENANFEASDHLRATQLRGGLALARSLMWLIGLVLILIAVFAALTFPGKAATMEMRSEWFSEIKDLIQLVVVSLLVPILATLLGYIFGRGPSSEASS
jgi:hypothetical protein